MNQNCFKLIYLILLPGILCLTSCRNQKKQEQTTPTQVAEQKPSAEEMFRTNQYVMIFETMDHFFKRQNTITTEYILKKLREKKEDTAYLHKIKRLHDQTRFIVKHLGFAKYFLYENVGGGYDTLGYTTKKPYSKDLIESYYIGVDKKGEGYALQKRLDDFVKYLNTEFKDINPDGFQPITYLQENNPLFKDYPELKNLDFVQNKFKDTPALLGMILICQLQLQALIYETKVLEYYEGDFIGPIKKDCK